MPVFMKIFDILYYDIFLRIFSKIFMKKVILSCENIRKKMYSINVENFHEKNSKSTDYYAWFSV